jgi:hypothetical protein
VADRGQHLRIEAMPYLIGTDEAGYAPNLGPLVISASVWWVADCTTGLDLYRVLKGHVCKSAPRGDTTRRLAIGDSKALYSPAKGLHDLERGVLAALALVARCPADWFDAWQLLDERSHARFAADPWHENYALQLPLAVDPEDLARLVPKLRRGLDRSGVRLVALRSRAVFPDEFNRSTKELGNKAEALSKITLALVAEMLTLCAGEGVVVVCDKHGGRNQYGRLLQQQFPDPLVEVYAECGTHSTYRWGQDNERIEIHFRAGGEAFMPAALASMTSKYLRELAMRAFNDFWCTRVPGLAPTAGYPGDARRFKTAIEQVQLALGIEDHVVWRDR